MEHAFITLCGGISFTNILLSVKNGISNLIDQKSVKNNFQMKQVSTGYSVLIVIM
jgi:hypothetical protein